MALLNLNKTPTHIIVYIPKYNYSYNYTYNQYKYKYMCYYNFYLY